MTTNEAAERLRAGLYWNDDSGDYLRDIDEALAAERRATVERIIDETQRAWREETRSTDLAAGYRTGLLTAQNMARNLLDAESDAHWAEHRARAGGD